MTHPKPLILFVTLQACVADAGLPFAESNQSNLGYVAPLTLNTLNLRGRGQKAYRPWFENGAWQGDLVEYDVVMVDAERGIVSLITSIDLSVSPPFNDPDTNHGANWSARLQLDAMDWDAGRKIITSDGAGKQIPFRWHSLSRSQKQQLDPASAANSTTRSPLLDFIRGDRSRENTDYRQRFSILGDIVHSNPVYVAEPREDYPFRGYTTFKNANHKRAPRIYVGANDGMLHAFDASTGDEVYAFIPSPLLGRLNLLSLAPYVHTYYVDGGLSAGDADFGGGTPDWHTVLVGAYGHGAKGLFALDITDPDLVSESSGDKVLWEVGTDDDLGNIFTPATIARLNDDKWYVVTGNGYGSANGRAVLLFIDVRTGAIDHRIDAGTATGNGLSGVALVDQDYDSRADFAYAGDKLGNLWKFDLRGSTKDTWTVALNGSPLFADPYSRGIVVTPDVARHFKGGYLVYFGTSDDPNASSAAIQTFYGIWDKDSTVADTALVLQSWNQSAFSSDKKIRTVTTRTIDWNTHKGWKIQLAEGESLQAPPVIRGGRVQFVTTILGGNTRSNWLMELDYLSGGPPAIPLFDLNGDGVLYAGDDVDLNNDGDFADAGEIQSDNVDANGDGDKTDPGDVVAGFQLPPGLVSAPLIALVTAGRDTLFINHLQPAFEEPCRNDCSGGFQGGHIDVDSDSPSGGMDAGLTCSTGARRPGVTGKDGPGFAGGTDGHQHEYDKAHGQVYVDYVGLEPLCDQQRADQSGINAPQRLNRVEEVGIDPNKKFVVLIANADLSPGGTLTIGDRRWNVVEYQKLIQQALEAAEAGDPASLNTLTFSLNEIRTKGTLRISFDDRAILDGGLLPIDSACVKGQLSVSSGRWRNGALTMQLLDVANHSNYETQSPTDLRTSLTIAGTTYRLRENGISYGGVHVMCDAVQSGNSTGFENFNCRSATAGQGFLYESSLFWHFGDLYRLYLEFKTGGKGDQSCAHRSSPLEAFIIERGGIPESDLGGFRDFVQARLDSASRDEDRQKYLEILARLQQVGTGKDSTLKHSNSHPALIAPPPIENNPTPGPSAKTGRRGWMEIFDLK